MAISFQSDIGVLRRVVMKHPEDAFLSEELLDLEWEKLNYMGRPDRREAQKEFIQLMELLQKFGIEIITLPQAKNVGLDSIYTRDASVVTDKGTILCNMGKKERKGEPEAQNIFYKDSGVSVLGKIVGNGTIEGGDVTWLDSHTLAVGLGYRTNDEGIRQLKALIGPEVDVIPVALPHFRGPKDVLHLMSILSPIDKDLAVVYSPLMSVSFRKLLIAKGFHLIDISEEEYDSLASNVLAVAPRVCVMAEGSPKTKKRLEDHGVEVEIFSGAEICLKGTGGPTCLTRPLEREI
jgi:N-dimethylarginine dimethylaminohydrolase